MVRIEAPGNQLGDLPRGPEAVPERSSAEPHPKGPARAVVRLERKGRRGKEVTVVEQLGLTNKIDHVSTGGGALINFLAGRELPLIAALKRSRAKFAKQPQAR